MAYPKEEWQKAKVLRESGKSLSEVELLTGINKSSIQRKEKKEKIPEVPEKKLSLKERFVKYITSKETAEVFNSALAAMNGGHYVPLDR